MSPCFPCANEIWRGQREANVPRQQAVWEPRSRQSHLWLSALQVGSGVLLSPILY